MRILDFAYEFVPVIASYGEYPRTVTGRLLLHSKIDDRYYLLLDWYRFSSRVLTMHPIHRGSDQNQPVYRRLYRIKFGPDLHFANYPQVFRDFIRTEEVRTEISHIQYDYLTTEQSLGRVPQLDTTAVQKLVQTTQNYFQEYPEEQPSKPTHKNI